MSARDLSEELPLRADSLRQDVPDVGPYLAQDFFQPSRSNDRNLVSYSQMICADVPTSNLRLSNLGPERSAFMPPNALVEWHVG